MVLVLTSPVMCMNASLVQCIVLYSLIYCSSCSLQWEKFMELGSSIDNKVIEDKIAQLNPGHCASIIYTVRDIRINTHQYYYY